MITWHHFAYSAPKHLFFYCNLFTCTSSWHLFYYFNSYSNNFPNILISLSFLENYWLILPQIFFWSIFSLLFFLDSIYLYNRIFTFFFFFLCFILYIFCWPTFKFTIHPFYLEWFAVKLVYQITNLDYLKFLSVISCYILFLRFPFDYYYYYLFLWNFPFFSIFLKIFIIVLYKFVSGSPLDLFLLTAFSLGFKSVGPVSFHTCYFYIA